MHLKKFSLGNFTKSVFQSSFGLNLLNLGLAQEFILIVGCKENVFFLFWLFFEKKVLSRFSDSELEMVS